MAVYTARSESSGVPLATLLRSVLVQNAGEEQGRLAEAPTQPRHLRPEADWSFPPLPLRTGDLVKIRVRDEGAEVMSVRGSELVYQEFRDAEGLRVEPPAGIVDPPAPDAPLWRYGILTKNWLAFDPYVSQRELDDFERYLPDEQAPAGPALPSELL